MIIRYSQSFCGYLFRFTYTIYLYLYMMEVLNSVMNKVSIIIIIYWNELNYQYPPLLALL